MILILFVQLYRVIFGRQVHGLLHAVPRRRGAQGRQRRHRYYQEQEERSVRGLVPNWLQGWWTFKMIPSVIN